jgi:hypothetical protein
VYETRGVQPVFLNQKDAIDYATARACFRSGEIRVLDSTGNVERTIAFSEAFASLVIVGRFRPRSCSNERLCWFLKKTNRIAMTILHGDCVDVLRDCDAERR